MPVYNITQAAAPANVVATPKAKGIRVKCDPVEHIWFDRLAMCRYNSSSDAASDINVQDVIVASGSGVRVLNDTSELTKGSTYWYRVFFFDIYGNQSLKATAVSATYRGANDGDVDKTAPNTPTGLTLTQVAKNTDTGDGKIETAVRATWTAPGSGVEVKRYVLEISDGTDTYYRYPPKSGYKFEVTIGKTYTVKVSAESIFGEPGAQTTGVSITPTAKTTAPTTPSSLVLDDTYTGMMGFFYDEPTDPDYSHTNVFVNFINSNPVGATFFGTLGRFGGYLPVPVNKNLVNFWVAHVNRSRVETSWIGPEEVDTKGIDANDVAPDALIQTVAGNPTGSETTPSGTTEDIIIASNSVLVKTSDRVMVSFVFANVSGGSRTLDFIRLIEESGTPPVLTDKLVDEWTNVQINDNGMVGWSYTLTPQANGVAIYKIRIKAGASNFDSARRSIFVTRLSIH